MTIHIINGPNLNLIGTREPNIYGKTAITAYIDNLKREFSQIDIQYFQSNSEGQLIDYIQACAGNADGIIINAAAYSHSSPAIADALAAVNIPAVEVHISNIFKREQFRHRSFTAPQCQAVISGMGLDGYRSAIEFLFRKHLQNNSRKE